MKTKIMIPTILIALIVTSGSVFAWGGGHYRGGNCQPGQGMMARGQGPAAMTLEEHQAMASQRIERMSYMLNLSAEQQTKLTALFDQHWQDNQSLRTKMQASRDMLAAMRNAPDFNEAEFRAEAQKHADMRTDMMVQRASMQQKINALLTPEQQEKAKTLFPGQGQGQGFGCNRLGAGDCTGARGLQRGNNCGRW
jgi:Spy/CpxP family protein refolding chaperone